MTVTRLCSRLVPDDPDNGVDGICGSFNHNSVDWNIHIQDPSTGKEGCETNLYHIMHLVW